MPDEPNGLRILEFLERLRDDVREDLVAMEGRMTRQLEDNRRELVEYTSLHAQEHTSTRVANEAIHKRFDDFINASSMAQARRDGALGVFRFTLETVSRNWRAALLLFSALGLALGNVHVNLNLT